MSKVIADISMSLDGYVTAPGVDQEHGLGIGGEAIHAWVLEEPRSPVDEAGVRERLQEILTSGVAFSDEDVVIGVATVAAPIFDHRGKIVASLAFNLFPEQLRSEREPWAEVARMAGMDASRAFGYSGPAAPQATDEA